ncbi:cell cycle protein MesJ [Bordetella pertussis]|nr:cell cycle protein MesJ [Bordetella pertussis]
MPTEARLAELQRQLRQLHALGHDRHLALPAQTLCGLVSQSTRCP